MPLNLSQLGYNVWPAQLQDPVWLVHCGAEEGENTQCEHWMELY